LAGVGAEQLKRGPGEKVGEDDKQKGKEAVFEVEFFGDETDCPEAQVESEGAQPDAGDDVVDTQPVGELKTGADGNGANRTESQRRRRKY